MRALPAAATAAAESAADAEDDEGSSAVVKLTVAAVGLIMSAETQPPRPSSMSGPHSRTIKYREEMASWNVYAVQQAASYWVQGMRACVRACVCMCVCCVCVYVCVCVCGWVGGCVCGCACACVCLHVFAFLIYTCRK